VVQHVGNTGSHAQIFCCNIHPIPSLDQVGVKREHTFLDQLDDLLLAGDEGLLQIICPDELVARTQQMTEG
jgi:hypothetical protein